MSVSMPGTAGSTTIEEALRKGTEFLRDCGADSPRLDMELILAHSLGIERIQLYLRIKEPLDPAARERSRSMLKRRREREPIAYILGCREFYGLKFEVTPDVLIPRPETELIVDRAVRWSAARTKSGGPALVMADIGTGSGAIAVACAHEQLKRGIAAHWIATDVSPAALAVARRNAALHGVADRIEFVEGNLLDPLLSRACRVDCLCSNPPYISQDDLDSLAPEVARWEPRGALVGDGPEGMGHVTRLAQTAPEALNAPGLLLIEIGKGQADAVANTARRTGRYADIEFVPDLAGIQRVFLAQLAQGAPN